MMHRAKQEIDEVDIYGMLVAKVCTQVAMYKQASG